MTLYRNRKTLMALMLFFLLVYQALLFYYHDHTLVISWVSNGLSSAGTLLCALLCTRIERSSYTHTSRNFWRMITLSFWIYFLSMLLYSVDAYSDQVSFGYPGIPDLLWVLYGGILLLAILLLVHRYLRGLKAVRYLIDTTIFMTAMGALSWTYLILPALHEALHSKSWYFLFINGSFPVIDLGILFLMCLLFFSSHHYGISTLNVWLFVSLIVMIFADFLYLYLTTTDQYYNGHPMDPLWTASMFGILMSGIYSLRRREAQDAPPPRRSQHDGWVRRLLPYAGLALLFFLIYKQLPKFDMTIAACSLMIILIVIRQVLILTENDYLVNRLSHSLERTDYEANHDSLTALPNRRHFDAILLERLRHANRKGGGLAVLFLDLDRFKQVNDSLGHAAGDELLLAVAHRLKARITPGAQLSRIGGDEFTIIMCPFPGMEEMNAMVAAIQHAFLKPIKVRDHALHVSVSIGASLYPRHGITADGLMKSADIAMYEAKRKKSKSYVLFHESLNQHLDRKIWLESELYRAIERNELMVYYQPQLSLETGRCIGMEALLRWKHSELGFVSPLEFIPIAEECGLIVQLTDWVMQKAFRQQMKWKNAGLHNLRISVNISTFDFQDDSFVERITATLQRTGINPADVILEVTESIMIQNMEDAFQKINHLKQCGIQFAIDDFGTGFASFNYLDRLQPNMLKIDRVFIEKIGRPAESGEIVKAIITLGKNLGLTVVAEGVESPEQLAFLETAGCDEIQGYLYGKPQPPEDLVPEEISHSFLLSF